jgi:NADPH:quinone reductase-like Zn-dependent oxidoreductase
MNAVILTQYGSPDVLQLKQVAKPTPKDNEVLIKIHAAPVNFGDTLIRKFNKVTPRSFNMPFLFWFFARISLGINKPKPQILGSEFAGTIAAVGKGVTRFKVGEEVFGYASMNFGTNAEYMAWSADKIISPKPANMTFEEAATVPYGALTALNLLRKVNIQKGQKVLINGASGGIGSYAVQLAKHYGAEVTGVCGTQRMEFVKALGADKVIDYTKEDFTRNGETYDVVMDILNKSSFAKVKKSLTPNGRYLLASFKMPQLLQMVWTSLRGGKKVICALSMESPADLELIKSLVEGGAITTQIDRQFPLAQTADAHRYMESGERRGHVVIQVAG